MLWLLLGVPAGVLLLLIGWGQMNARGRQPAVYTVRSSAEVEPFIRSWGQWLDERGRIVVRHSVSGVEAEFRKRRYRRRKDVLLFRFRNADANWGTFEEVRARFHTEGVAHELERTQKQNRPRALVVALDPDDVFTPVAAVRLLNVALSAADSKLHVYCEGRLRSGKDIPLVAMLPRTTAHRAGFEFGSRIGRLWARLIRA